MAQAIAAILPFAVGIMVSPIPIVAVILMLFTKRATSNGPAFLIGWVVGLTLLGVIGYAAASLLGWGDGSDTSATEVQWWRVALGVVLLVLAFRKWRKAAEPDHVEELPRWMADIDELTPAKAFTLALALSSVNPKNLILGLGAMTSLATLGAPTDEVAVGIIAFVVVSSITVAAAVAYRLLGGESAQRSLSAMQVWLKTHNDAVMAVLLLVFGVLLLSEGLGG
jgi:threonine/homoserine/homoserine lactone efflux protein